MVFKRSVSRDLRRLPKRDVARILGRLNEIAEAPRGAGVEKLSGLERYRTLQGDYRIIYEIRDEVLVVLVVKVGHRREVCR